MAVALLGTKRLHPEAIIATEAAATGFFAVQYTFLLTRVFFRDSVPAHLDTDGKGFLWIAIAFSRSGRLLSLPLPVGCGP